MITTVVTERAFHKIQHCFMIKSIQQTKNRTAVLYHVKGESMEIPNITLQKNEIISLMIKKKTN